MQIRNICIKAKMNKNKSNTRHGSGIEDDPLLPGLLRRMEEDSLSVKEKKLILELKKTPKKEGAAKKLSRAELNRAVRRNRQAILQKRTGIAPSREKRSVRKLLAVGAAAAVVLIMLALPFYKTHHSFRQEAGNAYNSNYYFSTENNIKKITLADGSIIHLNRGSSLSLKRETFNNHTREVWLDEGEAFFDIAKDPDRPFIVHSKNGITTRVLGTSFNIKSYSALSGQVISVNTGKVQVFNNNQEKIVLDPNQKVSVSDENGNFTSGRINAQSASDWRSGKIVLDQASVEEVAFRLKQYYDKELTYDEQQFAKDRIYSFFTLQTPFEEVITVVSKLMNASYTEKEGKVYLVKKSNNQLK